MWAQGVDIWNVLLNTFDCGKFSNERRLTVSDNGTKVDRQWSENNLLEAVTAVGKSLTIKRVLSFRVHNISFNIIFLYV
jgi:hypothetical protein